MDVCVAAAGILRGDTDGLTYPAKQFKEVGQRCRVPMIDLASHHVTSPGHGRERERRAVYRASSGPADGPLRERRQHHYDREYQRARVQPGSFWPSLFTAAAFIRDTCRDTRGHRTTHPSPPYCSWRVAWPANLARRESESTPLVPDTSTPGKQVSGTCRRTLRPCSQYVLQHDRPIPREASRAPRGVVEP